MNLKEMPKPNEALHDFFKDNEVFADVFNSGIFRGERIVDPAELKPVDTAYAETVKEGTKKGKINRYRDIARSMVTSEGKYVILGIENQEHIHYSMPIRKMLYDVLEYMRQISLDGEGQDRAAWDVDERLSGTAKGTKVNPVITLIFYTGETPWDGPRSMYELMNIDEKFKPFIPDYPLFLIDIGHDESLSFENQDLEELHKALSLVYSEQTEYFKTEVSNKVLSLTGILANDVMLYKQANENTTGGRRDMCQALMERDRRSEEKGKQELLQKQIELGMISKEQALELGYVPQEDAVAVQS